MTQARLLDLTRSLRRAGRMPTGVDRVERAYLEHLLMEDVPLFALMRTALGYVILDGNGARSFFDMIEGRHGLPAPDFMSRMPRGRTNALAQLETAVRRMALARCAPFGLGKMLARHVSSGFDYYNTGHSNLTDRVLGAVKAAGGRVHVLVHDVIPLEYPEYQRAGTIAPFRDKLQRVSALADRVIYNSHDTCVRTETLMSDWGRVPPSIVAHLGTILPKPDACQIPDKLRPDRAYFVTVGTIEPRKNHAFLLDVWAQMGPSAPPLLVCGSRGWNNDAVFARLDALPSDSPVKEVSGLTDPALAALVQDSAGILFPSHAEGFGLPPIEALTLGTRVLCNDLPVLREIIGGSADFVPVSDNETWLRIIKSWESSPSNAVKADRFVGPNWPDHFKTVLRLR